MTYQQVLSTIFLSAPIWGPVVWLLMKDNKSPWVREASNWMLVVASFGFYLLVATMATPAASSFLNGMFSLGWPLLVFLGLQALICAIVTYHHYSKMMEYSLAGVASGLKQLKSDVAVVYIVEMLVIIFALILVLVGMMSWALAMQLMKIIAGMA